MTDKKEIIISSDPKSYFFDSLSEVNKKIQIPFPDAVLHYSSEVMSDFLQSERYFQKTDEGRIRDKILGRKYLQAINEEDDISKHEIKDVGETTLILCGIFKDSINPKIVDASYYYSLGKSAYIQMDKFFPSYFDIPGFYSLFANSFESITKLISTATSGLEKPFNPFEYDEDQIKIVS